MSPFLIVAIIVVAILYGWAAATVYRRARKQYNLFAAIFTGLFWLFVIVICGGIIGMADAARAFFGKEEK